MPVDFQLYLIQHTIGFQSSRTTPGCTSGFSISYLAINGQLVTEFGFILFPPYILNYLFLNSIAVLFVISLFICKFVSSLNESVGRVSSWEWIDSLYPGGFGQFEKDFSDFCNRD